MYTLRFYARNVFLFFVSRCVATPHDTPREIFGQEIIPLASTAAGCCSVSNADVVFRWPTFLLSLVAGDGVGVGDGGGTAVGVLSAVYASRLYMAPVLRCVAVYRAAAEELVGCW